MARSVPCAAGLVLELGHPAGLAEPGDAAQHPGQLGVLGHLGLHEHGAAGRVQPEREQLRDGDPGARGEQRRVVLDGDRVQVRDEVERVVVVLQGHPLPQRAEVVAEVERVRGRLDAGEHPRAAVGGGGHAPILSAASTGLGQPQARRPDAQCPRPGDQLWPSGMAMSVTVLGQLAEPLRLPGQQVDLVEAVRCRPPAGWPARSGSVDRRAGPGCRCRSRPPGRRRRRAAHRGEGAGVGRGLDGHPVGLGVEHEQRGAGARCPRRCWCSRRWPAPTAGTRAGGRRRGRVGQRLVVGRAGPRRRRTAGAGSGRCR